MIDYSTIQNIVHKFSVFLQWYILIYYGQKCNCFHSKFLEQLGLSMYGPYIYLKEWCFWNYIISVMLPMVNVTYNLCRTLALQKIKKHMGTVLKYKRYLARVRVRDRRWGLQSPLIFQPELRYCLYFKTVIIYFVYPAI